MNKNRNGWIARRIGVKHFMQRIGEAAAPGRRWQWRNPGSVIAPSGRVYDVKVHAGIWLRPAKAPKTAERAR